MAKILKHDYTREKVKEEVAKLIDMHDVCGYEVAKVVRPQSIALIRITIELPCMEPNEKIIV